MATVSFFVLEHQYGRRDVMWKCSIIVGSTNRLNLFFFFSTPERAKMENRWCLWHWKKLLIKWNNPVKIIVNNRRCNSENLLVGKITCWNKSCRPYCRVFFYDSHCVSWGGSLVVVFGERSGVELSMKEIRVEKVPTHKQEPIKLVLW